MSAGANAGAGAAVAAAIAQATKASGVIVRVSMNRWSFKLRVDSSRRSICISRAIEGWLSLRRVPRGLSCLGNAKSSKPKRYGFLDDWLLLEIRFLRLKERVSRHC